jgi:guanylate cyclase
MRERLLRLIAIADEPRDGDDVRVRKRVGVIAGYLTVIAPLSSPLQARFEPLSIALGVGLSLYAILNLLVLARTHRFERYVGALLVGGLVFVPSITVIGGGITGSTAGLAWGFLVPGYAIMALGPKRATPWFIAFLAMVGLLAAIDPLVHAAIGPAPYVLVLTDQVANALAPLTITFLLLRYLDLRRQEAEARADALLKNAIPAAIAVRLRHGEDRIAEEYAGTTVLFADIVGFTPWTRRTEPGRVVTFLDALFTRFDALAASRGVEKIKTIGDAYMAVAGAPEPNIEHADAALGLARDVLHAVAETQRRGGPELNVRIGLASGSVIGGVIGQQRILFDLWGETVNLAARMESGGVPGRIQVAPSTWELLRDRYTFEPRQIDAKGVGQMTAYLFAEGVVVDPASR